MEVLITENNRRLKSLERSGEFLRDSWESVFHIPHLRDVRLP